MMRAFFPAHILLPRPGTDLSKWAVIACDQFTSQPEYWDALNQQIGEAPSTLRLILPEAYLGKDEVAEIQKINRHMDEYLQKSVLLDAGNCMILVERQTPYVAKRLGLILTVDLEMYSYAPGSHPLIRATEQTVASRIPPRVKIREKAPIEIPHVLLLINDKEEQIIETLYAHRDTLELVYDFDLNMNGGHLRGYKVTDLTAIQNQFEKLTSPKYSQKMYANPQAGLLGLVGDGNHSLASAKAHWDNVKQSLTEAQKQDHPARYALVEVENIYDEGLKFEPIHRVVFFADQDFWSGLWNLQCGSYHAAVYTKTHGARPLHLPKVAPVAIKLIQDYIDSYIKTHPGTKVDYVHGMDNLQAICDKDRDAIGITLPPLAKADLFPYVLKEGVLPRKSFSMGEAVEKRYYFESKLIVASKI
ncbi:MAG: DUF1015 domain-containing protein [Candidatus Izemoplasmatales bacterium]|jgi:uncharacterized protein (DUF1015 family)|nr:DUF1015 domain-containing protein [Candidatus Izemoplasmatales bacterium]MDD3865806.1 DUF1015 domain-containing protein [Candidatus Izemoplasmatales bacterium]